MHSEKDNRIHAGKRWGPWGLVANLILELRASWRIWWLGLFFVGIAVALFIWLAGEILEQENLRWDVPLMLIIHHFSVPWLDMIMIVVTQIGYPGAFLVTAGALLWLWTQQQVVAALTLFVSVVGAGVLNTWLKLLFARMRPSVFPPLMVDTTYSFPSGHPMGAIALYGFIAYLLWQYKRRGWAMLAILFALLIAFSRIYLGVHYSSDILGALAIGVVWLAVVVVGYQAYRHWRLPPPNGTTGVLDKTVL